MSVIENVLDMNAWRRFLGELKRWVLPSPEVKAWRRAVRRSASVPRYTPGRIRLLDYELEYTDLCTVCPQWNDLFVRGAYGVRCTSDAPRILDLGANIGLASLYFKKRYPGARITAYEADPGICDVLRRNLRANGAGDVEVVNKAVWISDGDVSFDREGADSGSVVGSDPAFARGASRLAACRLRDVLARERFDVVKLDIEGAELEVLEDSRDVLDNVRALIMEVHEWKPDDRITPRVLELLSGAGYRYALDDLTPLPWREPVASADTAFAGRALTWVYLVRAFRTPGP